MVCFATDEKEREKKGKIQSLATQFRLQFTDRAYDYRIYLLHVISFKQDFGPCNFY